MLEPLLDRLVIKKMPVEAVSKSGLILPTPANQYVEMAKVIAVGPGPMTHEGKYVKLTLEVGDIIYVRANSGFPVSDDGEEYHVVKADEVIVRQTRQTT